MQAERQRRWYVNLTPEHTGGEAGPATRPAPGALRAADSEFRGRKRERDRLRIFAGENYICMADSPEKAEVMRAHIARRLAEFSEAQAGEREAWRLAGMSRSRP